MHFRPIHSARYVAAISLTVLCFVLLLFPGTSHAEKSSGTIALGFQSNIDSADIKAGAILSFQKSNHKIVELASADTSARLAGVIDQNPLVSIGNTSDSVQVVISGTASVLVSDINGPISAGDKITASPIKGVGMVASTDSQIIGTAQTNFDTSDAQAQTIRDRQGGEHTVHIGYVPLQVSVAYYQAPGSNYLPPFIQSVANSIAGRPVSLIRVMISGILLLMGFVIMAVLIYAAVRTSMSSLGRNPLAAATIRKGLYLNGGIAIIVFSVTLLGSYILLRV